MYLVTLRRSGPEWDPNRPLEEQSGWDAHAAFMDGLVDHPPDPLPALHPAPRRLDAFHGIAMRGFAVPIERKTIS